MKISITLPDEQASTLAALAAQGETSLREYVEEHLIGHAAKEQRRMDKSAALRRCSGCRQLNAGREVNTGIVPPATCHHCGKALSADGDRFVSRGLADFLEILVATTLAEDRAMVLEVGGVA